MVKRHGQLIDLDVSRIRSVAEASRDFLFEKGGVERPV
jgi:hypothetical protein